MGLRAWIFGGMASQLGKPTGLRGRLVGRMLNRANRGFIEEAIDALQLEPGAVAADLGFGGGVGLALLLDRVGSDGRVHGVDYSPTMVSRASRQFKRDVASGRLHLQIGSITKLPLEDGSVQGAITINTIYFITELDRAFSELAGRGRQARPRLRARALGTCLTRRQRAHKMRMQWRSCHHPRTLGRFRLMVGGGGMDASGFRTRRRHPQHPLTWLLLVSPA